MADTSARTVDDNGYVTVVGCPVSSYGIFDYAAWQVGLEDGDPDRIVKVYRPKDEIFSPEAVASFQIVPFIDEHDLLSAFEDDTDVMSPEEKGIDGVMVNVRPDDPWLRADVKIFTRRMKRALDSGKVELSLGYGCDFIVKSGTFNGEPYEVMQVNMRGNHLALVEAARVEGAKVLDSRIAFDCLFAGASPNQQGKPNMKIKRKAVGDASAVERLKALLPALEQFLGEEAQEPEHQGTVTPEAGLGESPEATPEVEHEAAEGDEGDIDSLIAQIEALLAELKGGEAEAPEAAEVPTGDEDPEQGACDEGEEDPEQSAEDEVEGLEGTAQDEETAPDDNGKASPGPAKGTNTTAQDAAIRKSIYADIARKQKLYDRVSPIIGAFDHATMTADDLAAYAARKLKINAPKGAVAYALDSYLTGVEKGKARTAKASNAMDSKFGECDVIDQYLKKGC